MRSFRIEIVSDLFHVFPYFALFVGRAQQEGRMKSRHYFYAVPFTPLASGSTDRFPRPEQTLKRRRSKGDYYTRTNEHELAKEKWFASLNLITLGSAV